MAINRISGRILQDDLQRDNDLSIQGNLLYLDIGNSRVGIGTASPTSTLEVSGNIQVGNIAITSSGLESSGNITITPTGNVNMSGVNINNIADPILDTDAATRQFVANSVADATFDVSDGVTTTTIDAGDTITVQGTANQIQSDLTGNIFTIGLPDDVTINGNLTVDDTLVVDGIDIGNNISGGGNLTIPGEITANTITANVAATFPYLTDNALVFTDSTDTLITYANIRYDGTGAIDIDDVPLNIDNVQISGNNITSLDNLSLTAASGSSVVVENLVVAGNDTPTLIYFVDSAGRATTDSNLFFSGSTLNVAGTIDAEQLTVDNVTIDNNQIVSDGNLILSAEANSFVTIDNTTGVIVPVGTTAERPTDPDAGTFRWNSDANYLEVYDGTEWVALGTDVTFITSQVITGDDSTTTFTLDQEATTSGVLVYINGVAQVPGTSYTVTGDQITFAEAPQTQDTVEIRFISLSQTISALTDESGETAIRVTAADQITFTVEGTEVGNISNSAVNFSSDTPISVGSQQLGFLDSPQRVITGNTTLADSDRGGHLYLDSVGIFEVTIPEQSSVPLPIGTQVAVISHSTADITINPDTGVELYLAGNATASSRTVNSYGRADLLKVGNNVWSISGFSIT